MSDRLRRRLLGLIGVVGALGLWQLGAELGLFNTLLLGSPAGVLAAAVREVQRIEFWEHMAISAQELALGVAISALVGIAVGVAAGWWPRFGYLVDPWLTIMYSTPSVAIAPLLILVFGIDIGAKIAVIFLEAMFPIAVNTMAGVQATANRYLRVARMFGASDPAILRTVVVPGALPYILTGFRAAGGRALVGLIAAELLAGNAGIGYLLSLAGMTFQTNTLMFLIVVIGLSGIGYTVLVRYMEERIERWRPAPVAP